MTGSFGDCQMHESIFCISFPAEAKTKVLAERLVIRVKTLCKFNCVSIRSGVELVGKRVVLWEEKKHLKHNVKQEVAGDCAITQKKYYCQIGVFVDRRR